MEKSSFTKWGLEVLYLGKSRHIAALIVVLGVLVFALSARKGIGFDIETDGTLFARGMLDEINVTLKNRDNHQQKVVAEIVAVRPGSFTAPDFLGEDATAAGTLNAGAERLFNMQLDTAELQAGNMYKVGVLVYENDNSTDFPIKGSLLAVSYVADVKICDPLEVVHANTSLCNEISVLTLESDETTN